MNEGPSRAGYVALVGWTNVGKSSLLNRLVGEKLAAVAGSAQTTRQRIVGVRSVPGRGQVAFVDTPGLHRPHHELNRAMLELARHSLDGADVAALVVDASRGLDLGDRQAVELVGLRDRVLVLNKIDLVRPKTKLLPLMHEAAERWGFEEILPVSALTGEGCQELLDRLLCRLPVAPPLFPEDYLTDQSERSLAAEWIREKLLALVREELPHATAVVIGGWNEREDGLVEVDATILVERESQRPIVIGRGGLLLKEVGQAARCELESLLGQRVFLRLWVQVRKDWRNDERTLRELGLR